MQGLFYIAGSLVTLGVFLLSFFSEKNKIRGIKLLLAAAFYACGCLAWLLCSPFMETSLESSFLMLISTLQFVSCIHLICRNEKVIEKLNVKKFINQWVSSILFINYLSILLWSKIFFPNVDAPPLRGMQFYDPRDWTNFRITFFVTLGLMVIEWLVFPIIIKSYQSLSMYICGIKYIGANGKMKTLKQAVMTRIIYLILIFIPGPLLAIMNFSFEWSMIALLLGFIGVQYYEFKVQNDVIVIR